MKQIFEVEWIGGTISPELVSATLHQYFQTLRYPIGVLTVVEITPNKQSQPIKICQLNALSVV